MAQRDTGSQSGWHVGTLRDRSGAGRHLEPPGSASGSPIRRDEVRTTSTPPPRPTSQELAAVTANPKPKSALYSSMSSDSPGGGSPVVPRSTSPSQGLAKIPSSPAGSSAPLTLPPPNYPLPSVPGSGSGSVSPNRPRLTAAPGTSPDQALLAPPAAAPASSQSQSLSPRRMSPANTSSMRVLDKDEIARRKRELENFDNSFLSVSRGIVVDCKEMNTLVQQVAQLVTSKAPHTSPKQRFVDLAMRTPKSCMTVCELIEQRISESLFASLKREQEVLQLCGRTVRNRVFALVRVAAQAMKDAELGRDVDFIPLATLTSDTAKSVKALLAAGSTLKLKESSMTQALQTKMRAFHTAQKLRLNEAAKENALVMRSMLQANTAGDKEQFLLLGRSLIVGFTKLMKEFKGPKVKTEERRLQLALSTLISDAKAAAKERTRQTQEQVEKSKTQLITAMKDYINAVLNAIDSSAIVYDGESLRALDKQQIEAAIKIQRRWRAYLQKKGRSATVRPASAETPGVARKTPKEYAIEEVITSEESYLSSLRTLLREFVQPLRKSSSTSAQPFITSKDIAVIFANVEQIVANTERFLDELKRARAEVGSVGNAFLRCMDLMGPYTEYTANFDRSQERIEALRANALFKNFVKECTKRVPGTLEMGSYLIMPVQRTPRYLILLEAVEKHTPPPDPDARVIHEAVERMKVLNDEINNYKNEQDNRYAFASISRRTQDFPMDLYKPDRFFLREVDFEFLRPKKSFFSTLSSPLSLPSAAPLPFTDKRQLNHFFIFNDLLVRAKPGRSPDTYVFEEAIPLSGFSVELLTEVRDGEWALRMTRKVSGREEELQFFVPDETTRTLWVTQLTQLLQALEVGELCI